MIDVTKLDRDDRAFVIDAAARILREDFGMLVAGDLIDGLTGAAASLRAQGGIIRPAHHRPAHQPPRDYMEADIPEAPGHGYHEVGDY